MVVTQPRQLPGWIVDRLPLWLWHSGNLYDVPGGTLHFCSDHSRAPDGHPVRTIEFSRTSRPSRILFRGNENFPFNHGDLQEVAKDDKENWGFIATWRAHRRQQRTGTGGNTA